MTWDLTIEQKDKFLELMHDMGANSMFYLNDMTKRLSECGLPVTEDSENNCLLIDGVKVHLAEPEWGKAGIYPPHVLSVVIEHFGFEITSDMTGFGFHFKDRLQQLASHWGLDKNYL
jgi:hypothetical protein